MDKTREQESLDSARALVYGCLAALAIAFCCGLVGGWWTL